MFKKIFRLLSDLLFALVETFISSVTYDDTPSGKMGRFTKPALDILTFSKIIALELSDEVITLHHLWIVMTRTKDSDAYNTLEDFDIIESKLLPFLSMKQIDKGSADISQQLDLSENYVKVLELSVDIARKRNQSVISSSALLIGLIQFDSEAVKIVLNHFEVEAKEIIKRADYHLSDSSSYEHTFIKSQVSRLQVASKYQQRKKRIKSTLQSFGFGQSTEQDDE